MKWMQKIVDAELLPWTGIVLAVNVSRRRITPAKSDSGNVPSRRPPTAGGSRSIRDLKLPIPW
jgi:hypothetical protein